MDSIIIVPSGERCRILWSVDRWHKWDHDIWYRQDAIWRYQGRAWHPWWM